MRQLHNFCIFLAKYPVTRFNSVTSISLRSCCRTAHQALWFQQIMSYVLNVEIMLVMNQLNRSLQLYILNLLLK